MKRPKVLIFDVDNTLYDFVGSFAPAFRSMVHALAKHERIEEDLIIESAKRSYAAVGTLEQQFLVENMDIFADRSNEDKDILIHLARVAFSRTRNARLMLYDGISELLTTVQESGAISVCVTNAPYYHVARRLKNLDILQYFSGLVAWKGSAIETHLSDYERRYADVHNHLSRNLSFFEALPLERLKPHKKSFADIILRYGDDCEYFSIGDSISKDLDPASELGITTIWARYGTFIEPNDLTTVIRVTPWSPGEIEPVARHVKPDYVADRPIDIAAIADIEKQASLF